MNKKIISAVLAVLMMSSTAAFAASAAEVEAEASKDSGKIQFDLGEWNHSDKINFYIWDATTSEYCSKDGWTGDNAWGSKSLRGTAVEGEDGIVESYEIDFSGREDHNVFVIFHNNNTNAQTYDCVLKPDALGRKAYMTGVQLENPVDSEKVAIEAVFDGVDPSVCGPYKQITSTGNIVGNCIAPADVPAKKVAQYLFDKMGSVDKGGEECVTDAKVETALNEFGTNADDVWAEFQTIEGHESKDEDAKKYLKLASSDTDTASDTDSAATDTDSSADNGTTGGSTGTSGSGTTSSRSSTTANNTTTATTSTSTTATASAEANAATGDTTGTATFAVVLAAAAATMILARKKVED
ncbi:MAG: hypothetical protein IIZ59_03605 [Clostridia bacterium]|nr:hypothetical protein [Clostridia bacterium]